MSAPCPRCGHADEQHQRQSWFDAEAVEGMTCEECGCAWFGWDWAEVVAGEATSWRDPEPPRTASDDQEVTDGP